MLLFIVFGRVHHDVDRVEILAHHILHLVAEIKLSFHGVVFLCYEFQVSVGAVKDCFRIYSCCCYSCRSGETHQCVHATQVIGKDVFYPFVLRVTNVYTFIVMENILQPLVSGSITICCKCLIKHSFLYY